MQSPNVSTVPALSKQVTRETGVPEAPPTTAIVTTAPAGIEVAEGEVERGTASVVAPVA